LAVAVKTIVLDFGNVVAFFDHRLTTNRLAPYAGISADALHEYLFHSSLADDYETGRINTAEFLSRVRETCRLTCTAPYFFKSWADIFWPNRDLITLLPELNRSHRLLLASNTNELHTEQFCQQFGSALRHFDEMIFSHRVGAKKPDRAFYEHCERFARCAPEECLFVDDLPANVAGARACGWNAFVYSGVEALQREFEAHGIDRKSKVTEIGT
jgi:putative hydrolase of the HAD superfamily